MNKDDLRNILKKQREAMSGDNVRALSKMLAGELANELRRREVKQIFGFFQSGKEPDVSAIVEDVAGAQWAFPVIDIKIRGSMEFYTWQIDAPTTVNRYGITEPDPQTARLITPTAETVILIPALAITRNGDRLGFGGGYYDRYLAKYPNVRRLGVVFNHFLLANIPVEQHDIRMHEICTEDGVVSCPQ